MRDLSAQIGSWESHIYATDSEIYNGIIESELKQATATILNTDPAGASKERFLAESGLQDGKDEQLDQQPRVRTFIYGVMMVDSGMPKASVRVLKVGSNRGLTINIPSRGVIFLTSPAFATGAVDNPPRLINTRPVLKGLHYKRV